MTLAVVRVFSTQLSICGIAQRLATSGRVKTFFNMLWNMEDPQLSGAYAAMQEAIEELGATVGMASYNAIRNTHDDVGKISDDMDKLDARIADFRSTVTEDVYTLYISNLAIDAKIDEGFVAVKQKQDQSYELQVYMAQTTQQILQAITTPTGQDIAQTKGDVGAASAKAAAHIRLFFENRLQEYPDFERVYDANLEQCEFLEREMIASPSEWLFADPTFANWRAAMNDVVWLQASDGTGKTFLTCFAHQAARTQWGASTNCGYFYFFPNRSSVEIALACIVLQIVSRNDRYAEAVAARLREEAVGLQPVGSDMTTWKHFLTPWFTSKDNSDRLFLFLDGFDEAQEDQKQLLINLAEFSQSNHSRISIFLTTRQNPVPKFGSLSPEVITITRERVRGGLTSLIKKRFQNRSELKRLSKAVKRAISKSLLEHADSKSSLKSES
jgi:phenolic acid decarboxylase